MEQRFLEEARPCGAAIFGGGEAGALGGVVRFVPSPPDS